MFRTIVSLTWCRSSAGLNWRYSVPGSLLGMCPPLMWNASPASNVSSWSAKRNVSRPLKT